VKQLAVGGKRKAESRKLKAVTNWQLAANGKQKVESRKQLETVVLQEFISMLFSADSACPLARLARLPGI